MRVLHIGKYYPPFSGGIENFMADLLPGLSEKGIEVAALVHDHSLGKLPRTEVHDYGKAKLTIVRVPSFGRILFAPVSPAFPFVLKRIIDEFKPDLIHLHLPNTSAFWVAVLTVARKVPWVVHWHADVVAGYRKTFMSLAYLVYRPFEQYLLSRSRKIIATSPNYLDSSIPLSGWKDKCVVIPLGISPARLEHKDDQQEGDAIERYWGESAFRVLAIGRLSYYKGFDVLIRSAIELPDNIRIAIVGDGELYSQLQEQIRKNSQEQKVTLTGKLSSDTVHALLRSCDCFCLPSVERTEAFGLVLLEAMYFGKAVIASDVPGSGIGWVAQHDNTAMLVEPANIHSLADAIKDMQAQTDKRLAMGRAGAERFRELFHIDPVISKTIELYNDVTRYPDGSKAVI